MRKDLVDALVTAATAPEERRQGVPGDREERRQGVPGDREERRQGVPGDREGRRSGVPGDREERRQGVPGDREGRRSGVPGEREERRQGVPGDRDCRQAGDKGTGLAQAALLIARIEYPRLDLPAYHAKLDAMGELARQAIQRHVDATGDSSTLSCIKAMNRYLFEELQFVGNRDKYEDPRNSCLNEVLDRRTGIPITLSVVYMETARRAGLQIDGVNFPGHFLVRCPDLESRRGSSLIIDPFHGGALLSEHDCRVLLQRHVGSEVAFSRSLLAPTTRLQIIVRMLLNLKRIYVHMRSFPQARDVTELLLAITPSALSELRDRGLLAYHLNDLSGALRDLQTYLKLASWGENDKEAREEHEQIWEHVKTLRRRVAGLN